MENAGVHVIDKNQEQYWAEHSTLGNSTEDPCKEWKFAIDNNTLLPACEESFYQRLLLPKRMRFFDWNTWCQQQPIKISK